MIKDINASVALNHVTNGLTSTLQRKRINKPYILVYPSGRQAST